jgi:hypothetical protein
MYNYILRTPMKRAKIKHLIQKNKKFKYYTKIFYPMFECSLRQDGNLTRVGTRYNALIPKSKTKHIALLLIIVIMRRKRITARRRDVLCERTSQKFKGETIDQNRKKL